MPMYVHGLIKQYQFCLSLTNVDYIIPQAITDENRHLAVLHPHGGAIRSTASPSVQPARRLSYRSDIKKIGRIGCFALDLRITTKALLVGRGVVVGGNELRVIVWNQITN